MLREKAAWAISNATSWKVPEQVRYLVNANCIPPIIELLKSKDNKVLIVCLDTLKNVLAVGQASAKGNGTNPYCSIVEECEGIDLLEDLQNHENTEIYKRALSILEHYFGAEEEDENLVPNVTHNQYTFSAPAPFSMPSGGFVFS